MGRSSRVAVFFVGLTAAPAVACAQLYGFPGEVGVIDDGFGVLPPQPGLFQPGPSGPPQPAPLFAPPVAERTACPLIIQIGRGLRHPARTRVTSGRPACR